jgi:hypothetical protein
VRKRAALLLIVVLIALSLIAVMPKSAVASITKPSVPEFTVHIVAYPYDVPTTHSIDPFTGQDITHQGYHVENKSIEVRIKNQPFTPYEIQENGDNWTTNFFYNIRIRGHFSEDWIELYRADDGYPHQWSDSDYTVISYLLGEGDADTVLGTKMIRLPAGGQVDFQVKAMTGYVSRKWVGNYGPFSVPYVFTGETSGWSNTQTLTIPASGSSSSSSSSPTSTPDQTAEPAPSGITEPTATNDTSQTLQLATVIGTAIVVAVVSAGLLVYFKRRKRLVA